MQHHVNIEWCCYTTYLCSVYCVNSINYVPNRAISVITFNLSILGMSFWRYRYNINRYSSRIMYTVICNIIQYDIEKSAMLNDGASFVTGIWKHVSPLYAASTACGHCHCHLTAISYIGSSTNQLFLELTCHPTERDLNVSVMASLNSSNKPATLQPMLVNYKQQLGTWICCDDARRAVLRSQRRPIDVNNAWFWTTSIGLFMTPYTVYDHGTCLAIGVDVTAAGAWRAYRCRRVWLIDMVAGGMRSEQGSGQSIQLLIWIKPLPVNGDFECGRSISSDTDCCTITATKACMTASSSSSSSVAAAGAGLTNGNVVTTTAAVTAEVVVRARMFAHLWSEMKLALHNSR